MKNKQHTAANTPYLAQVKKQMNHKIYKRVLEIYNATTLNQWGIGQQECEKYLRTFRRAELAYNEQADKLAALLKSLRISTLHREESTWEQVDTLAEAVKLVAQAAVVEGYASEVDSSEDYREGA